MPPTWFWQVASPMCQFWYKNWGSGKWDFQPLAKCHWQSNTFPLPSHRNMPKSQYLQIWGFGENPSHMWFPPAHFGSRLIVARWDFLWFYEFLSRADWFSLCWSGSKWHISRIGKTWKSHMWKLPNWHFSPNSWISNRWKKCKSWQIFRSRKWVLTYSWLHRDVSFHAPRACKLQFTTLKNSQKLTFRTQKVWFTYPLVA